MSTVTESRKQVNKEYGKRPYVDEDPKDYIEYSKRPTDKEMFDRLEEKHSEFKKPYMFDDYQEMEYYYPAPEAWWSPAWDLGGSGNTGDGWAVNWWMGDYKGDSPADDEAAGWLGWYIMGCKIECPLIIQGDACDEDEHCCYFNPAWQVITNVEATEGDSVVEFTKNDPDDWNIHLPGEIRKGFCFKVTEASGIGKIVFEATTQATGIQRSSVNCEVELTYNCGCNCATADTFEIDTGASATTIAPGGTATIVVQGGCEDYTWSVSGTGYTLDNATTTVLSNTLNCAAGTCGDVNDYSAIATVTITDNCSTEITTKIRNTGGQWVNQTNTDCEVGTGTDSTCYTILGDHRYGTHWHYGGQIDTVVGSCGLGPTDASNYCYGQWDYGCVSILLANAERYSCSGSPLLLPCACTTGGCTACIRQVHIGGDRSNLQQFSNLTDDLWEC